MLTNKPAYEIKLKDYYRIWTVVFSYLQNIAFKLYSLITENDHLKSSTIICYCLDPVDIYLFKPVHTVTSQTVTATSQKRSDEQYSNNVVLNLNREMSAWYSHTKVL